MTCEFDKNRPCGSTIKSKNRYTKAQLHKVAKECGIKNVENKTMDQLCKELRLHKTQQKPKTLMQKIKSYFLGDSKQKTIQQQKMIQQVSNFHNRPCGPRKSAKNPTAYTRAELEKIAEKYMITNIKTKKMSELCAELKILIKKQTKSLQQKPKSLQQIKKTPIQIGTYYYFKNPGSKSSMKKPISKKSPIKKKPIPKQTAKVITKGKQTPIKKNPITKGKTICSEKSKNAYKPNYECNEKTGTWKKLPKSGTYHYKYELNKMSYQKLKQIAINLKAPATQQGNKQKLIQKILQVQYPLAKMSYNQKNKYIKKFKQILLSKKTIQIPKKLHTTTIVKAYSTCCKISDILNSKMNVIHKTLNNYGYKDLIKYKKYIGSDLDGIKNIIQWLHDQFDYQTNLPFVHKLNLLAYTYGGDVMMHAYLDKVFEIKQSWKFEYINARLHPLYSSILHMMITCPTEFKDKCIEYRPDGMTESQVTTEIEKIGYKACAAMKDIKKLVPGHIVLTKYTDTMKLFFMNPPTFGYFKSEFYDMLVKQLITDVKSLIFKAPRLSNNVYVYKGLKSDDFMNFETRNMYKNKRFISTTINPKITQNFSGMNCCLQKIHLLKGTSCIYVYISYFQEFEILLPPDRIFYALSEKYKPLNTEYEYKNKTTTNLIVTN